MQYINLNKTLELENKIQDLLLISIDEQIDTIDDKDGARILGKIYVSGTAKTLEGNKDFAENIDLDIFLSYDEIESRNNLNVSVNDFNYKIENNKLYLDISIKIDGLKEIETTFLAEESDELPSKKEVEEQDEINDERELEEQKESEDKKVYIDEEIIVNNQEDREINVNKEETINELNKEIDVEEEITNKEESDEITNIEDEEREVEENIEEITGDIIKEENIEIVNEKTNIEEKIKKSLLKSVFSNKRIKEEVSWKLHCVKDETTYEQIATKYGVNLNELVSINKNEKLVEGKLIFLPLK